MPYCDNLLQRGVGCGFHPVNNPVSLVLWAGLFGLRSGVGQLVDVVLMLGVGVLVTG